MKISSKGFVMLVAAIASIPASFAGVAILLGSFSSLNYGWMQSLMPYLYSSIAFAMLMWVVALVLDYRDLRHTAAEAAKNNAKALVEAERNDRMIAVESVHQSLSSAVSRIDASIRELAARPSVKPLKERTTELANNLLAFLNQQGPEPPNPLSYKGGDDTERHRIFNAYFDRQKHIYFHYMAYLKKDVVQTDYELAAAGIFTKLEQQEIDPPPTNHEVDLKKIADALLLTVSRMSGHEDKSNAAVL